LQRKGCGSLPFIAKFAMALAAILCVVSSFEFLSSVSKDVSPPASTIFFWFLSATSGLIDVMANLFIISVATNRLSSYVC